MTVKAEQEERSECDGYVSHKWKTIDVVRTTEIVDDQQGLNVWGRIHDVFYAVQECEHCRKVRMILIPRHKDDQDNEIYNEI